MEIVSYLINIKEDINDMAMGKVNNLTPLLKSLTAQLNIVIKQLQNKSKSCANCNKLYQCNDVRKHTEWHCDRHVYLYEEKP